MKAASAPVEPPAAEQILADVRRALAEDIGSGDVSAELLPASSVATADVVCRDAAVLAGAPWFDACLRELDAELDIEWHCRDAARIEPGTRLCRIKGRARALLSAERSALNFLQTLSATASITASYVAALDGSATVILDTRKTLPGLRLAQKYAVRCGGGGNHRMGLYDAILIKENHIAASGSLAAAVRAARAMHPTLLLEVEVETMQELDQALEVGVDRIMLDEFGHEAIREAVQRVQGRVPLEVSGSVTLSRVAELARLGVDFISVGALTKNIHAIDMSMRVQTS